MPSNRDEIIGEIKAHIQKFGGGFGEWCVGTAKDPRSPFFQSHRVAEVDDGLIYREAFTPGSAQAIRDHLVSECGLRLDLDGAPEPGCLVFAYRQTAPGHTEARSGRPGYRKLAA
jgi:hypothetical protein